MLETSYFLVRHGSHETGGLFLFSTFLCVASMIEHMVKTERRETDSSTVAYMDRVLHISEPVRGERRY